MGKRGNEKRKGETARRIWEALRSPTPESESSFGENSTVSERLARFDDVEKAPCTDPRSDPTLLPKFLQNYAGERVRQPRTPNTSAARKSLTN